MHETDDRLANQVDDILGAEHGEPGPIHFQ
jgi:hypothetical protein